MQDEDPYKFGCFMRTPKGEIITQYDLHDCEAAGMTKLDILVTEVQDKLIECIRLLQEDNCIEPELTLKEAYNKYLHPDVLPIEDEKIWKTIQNVEVLDLFQLDSPIGRQGAKKVKPRSMYELSDTNGLIRLMTAEKGAETPMDKYVRFKNDINLWYKEMDDFGLTKEEQNVLKPYFLQSHGVPPSQEQMMLMLMDEKICHFTLAEANAARKIVGKKQMKKIPELKKKVLEQGSSEKMGKYVWECGISPQMRLFFFTYTFIILFFYRISNRLRCNKMESNLLEHSMLSC
jgi:DNA polymerase-3 subunit alpha